MSALRIAGIEVPVDRETWRVDGDEPVGTFARSSDGGILSTVRSERWRWSFVTAPISQEQLDELLAAAPPGKTVQVSGDLIGSETTVYAIPEYGKIGYVTTRDPSSPAETIVLRTVPIVLTQAFPVGESLPDGGIVDPGDLPGIPGGSAGARAVILVEPGRKIEEGVEVVFDGTRSLGAATFAWSFGDKEGWHVNAPPRVKHVYRRAGTYVARLRVTGHDGAVDEAAVEIVVLPADIKAKIEYIGPDVLRPGQKFRLTARESRGTGLFYRWDFSDGTTSTQRDVEHSFSEPGLHGVTLTVTDAWGRKDQAKLTLRVYYEPQEVKARLTVSPERGGDLDTVFVFSARESEGQDLVYDWDFGDGTTKQTGQDQPDVQHQYQEYGTYTATLTATEQMGLGTSQASVTLSIEPALPPLKPVIRVIEVGASNVTLESSPFTDPNTYSIHAASQWQVLDGDNRVVFDSGWVQDVTAIIERRPAQPRPGVPVWFSAHRSRGIDLRYSWDFGNGVTSTDKTKTVTYNEAGHYEVRLTVRDRYGRESTIHDLVAVMESVTDDDGAPHISQASDQVDIQRRIEIRNVLKPLTFYQARVRHKDSENLASEWSDPVAFTTKAPPPHYGPAKPTLEVLETFLGGVKLKTSPFVMGASGGAHYATQWLIYDRNWSIVFDSTYDRVFLTEITIEGLPVGYYLAFARHIDSKMNPSEWSDPAPFYANELGEPAGPEAPMTPLLFVRAAGAMDVQAGEGETHTVGWVELESSNFFDPNPADWHADTIWTIRDGVNPATVYFNMAASTQFPGLDLTRARIEGLPVGRPLLAFVTYIDSSLLGATSAPAGFVCPPGDVVFPEDQYPPGGPYEEPTEDDGEIKYPRGDEGDEGGDPDRPTEDLTKRPRKPTMRVTNAGEGNVVMGKRVEFACSEFRDAPEDNDEHDATRWQVAEDEAFSKIVADSKWTKQNKRSWWVEGLEDGDPKDPDSGIYYARCAHRDSDGDVSEWSDVVRFRKGEVSIPPTEPPDDPDDDPKDPEPPEDVDIDLGLPWRFLPLEGHRILCAYDVNYHLDVDESPAGGFADVVELRDARVEMREIVPPLVGSGPATPYFDPESGISGALLTANAGHFFTRRLLSNTAYIALVAEVPNIEDADSLQLLRFSEPQGKALSLVNVPGEARLRVTDGALSADFPAKKGGLPVRRLFHVQLTPEQIGAFMASEEGDSWVTAQGTPVEIGFNDVWRLLVNLAPGCRFRALFMSNQVPNDSQLAAITQWAVTRHNVSLAAWDAPHKPVLTVDHVAPGTAIVKLEFSDPDTWDSHAATWWELAADADFNQILNSPSWDTENRTSAQFFGLDDAGTYYVRARVRDSTGLESEYSEVLEIDMPGLIPAAPSDLVATAIGLDVKLEWHDNSHNEIEFRIERHAGDGTWQQIATVAADTEEYVDEDLQPGTYTYRVIAASGAGTSAPSNEATVTVGAQPPDIWEEELDAPLMGIWDYRSNYVLDEAGRVTMLHDARGTPGVPPFWHTTSNPNNLPVWTPDGITFDGVDDRMALQNGVPAAWRQPDYHIVLVLKFNSYGQNRRVINNFGDPLYCRTDSTGDLLASIYHYETNTTIATARLQGGALTSSFRVYHLQVRENRIIRVTCPGIGSAESSGERPGSSFSTFYIGSAVNPAGFTLRAVMFFSSLPSEDDIAKINAWAAAVHGASV